MPRRLKRVIDTNLVIRYFVDDDSKKATAVEELFTRKNEILILTDVAIAEIVWVLLSHYKESKERIIEKINSLLTVPNLQINNTLIVNTLLIWKQHTIDFIDAYLTAYSIDKKLDGIYSYDKGIDKIKSVKRLEP